MCGIVGYTGNRKIIPVLLEGLRRLEYRGYDSAGLVYQYQDALVKFRAAGKPYELANPESEIITSLQDYLVSLYSTIKSLKIDYKFLIILKY